MSPTYAKDVESFEKVYENPCEDWWASGRKYSKKEEDDQKFAKIMKQNVNSLYFKVVNICKDASGTLTGKKARSIAIKASEVLNKY